MSPFALYFNLGLQHIADFQAYDHMLFLVALSAGLDLRAWKKALILVTAFTLGHSLTLALATLRVVVVPSEWVEFFIPVTILFTAVYNLLLPVKEGRQMVLYGMAVFFGLIHGLGFSNYLRAILGQEESIIWPLFSFNLGLEAGQVLIVLALLTGGEFALRRAKLQPEVWTRVLSVIAVVVSGWLIVKAATGLV